MVDGSFITFSLQDNDDAFKMRSFVFTTCTWCFILIIAFIFNCNVSVRRIGPRRTSVIVSAVEVGDDVLLDETNNSTQDDDLQQALVPKVELEQKKRDSFSAFTTSTFGASHKDSNANSPSIDSQKRLVDTTDRKMEEDEDDISNDQVDDDTERLNHGGGFNTRVWGGTSEQEKQLLESDQPPSESVSVEKEVDVNYDVDTEIYKKVHELSDMEKNTLSEEARLDLFNTIVDDTDPIMSSHVLHNSKIIGSTTLLKSSSVKVEHIVPAESFGKVKDDSGAKRLWGSTNTAETNSDNIDTTASTEANNHEAEKNSTEKKLPDSSQNIPFVAVPKTHGTNSNSKMQQHLLHHPVDGFHISARVYIDIKDAKAHFDYSDDRTKNMKELTLPYWDCGVFGSTTSPLSVNEAFFRTSIGAASTSWINAGDYIIEKHNPVLVIALSPCLLELNSGESRHVMSGDVLLLEDSILPGHRFGPPVSTNGGTSGDIKLLFLTLPHHHYRVGKENFSLQAAIEMKPKDPCPDKNFTGQPSNHDVFTTFVVQNEKNESINSSEIIIKRQGRYNTMNRIIRRSSTFYWNSRRLRLFMLSTVGISISALAADFIGRTAPLWLAVGIGGVFFVGFGTFGFTVVMDRLLSSIELNNELRRLAAAAESGGS